MASKRKNYKFLVSDPRPNDVYYCIEANANPELPYPPSDIKEIQQIYKEFDDFKKGKENWYQPSAKMARRISIQKFFTDMSLKIHNELMDSHAFRTIMPVEVVRNIVSVQEHVNYTVNENQFNML